MLIRQAFAALCAIVAPISFNALAADDIRVIDSAMHHLRRGTAREWDEFPQTFAPDSSTVRFQAAANAAEQTLRVRHRDLKFSWVIRLNGKDVAALPKDENSMVTYWPVPAGTLRAGENELVIACTAPASEKTSDDVTIGDVALFAASRQQILAQATVEVTVTDANEKTPLPCRITVAEEHGAMESVGNISDKNLAVRPGVVYTGDGHALLSLAAGKYTIYAGRGFAYSLDSARVDLHAGDAKQVALHIRRVVPSNGYVSCDTHVHTFTWSRHGDATIEERMLTLAGENIELPIATDHNLQIDYAPTAAACGVRKYFTPVIGNEVTTARLGHFNVFPISKEAHLLNWRLPTWAALGRNFMEIAGDPLIVLNHARDIHGPFRPFDPSRHISCTGEDLDGWEVPANAMEVINSGATQTDAMQLYRDWFGMLNRGQMLTPIGASDSHTVSTYIVGQARTYIRCDSADPGNIDVARAIRSLHEGRVLVSYGLLTDISVAGKFGPGDLVPADAIGDSLEVNVRVFGPEWTRATHVTLYANGAPIREADIATPAGQKEPGGLKWQTTWKLPRPRHDTWLVAVAIGPGVSQAYWPMNKPYQPASTAYERQVIGSTGAVRVDADGSGRFESAHAYAAAVVAASKGDIRAAVAALSDYDEATAAQAAGMLRASAPDEFEKQARAALAGAAPATVRGFEDFLRDWAAARSVAKRGK
jgi:hypothetical protein